MLREILCLLGLAFCAPAQADVSAHTIINVLRQTDDDTEARLAALGSLYDSVQVQLDREDGRFGPVFVAGLYRGQVQKATLRCDTFVAPETVTSVVPNNPRFDALARAALTDGIRSRLSCTFLYLDKEREARAFQTGAEIWAEHNLGALTPDPGPRSATARLVHDPEAGETLSIIRSDGGPVTTVVLLWLADLKED
jgi:hypothetical protein